MRDHLRKTQVKATLNYLILNTSYMIPVNLVRILIILKMMMIKTCKEPKFFINMIDKIIMNKTIV